MSQEDRINWDVGDAVVRPPTPDEIEALGGVQWEPPRTAPPIAPVPVDLTLTRDGLTAAVEEHGELGPVLVNGDHAFTSEADFD